MELVLLWLLIVKYYLDHDKDYKTSYIKYSCKYTQLYQWVKKYERSGEEGLIDKRGKRKAEEELSELDKAQRKIAQLERDMVLNLLPKAKYHLLLV